MDDKMMFDEKMQRALEELKVHIDETFVYLDKYPEESDRVARTWSQLSREFLNYGMEKSKSRKGENLFKKVSRMIIFGG